MTSYLQHGLTDTEAVISAATYLKISEFELFETAYNLWFHRNGEVHSLEQHFVQYLFEGTVPFWVRHYLRHLDIGKHIAYLEVEPLNREGIIRLVRLALFLMIPFTCNLKWSVTVSHNHILAS